MTAPSSDNSELMELLGAWDDRLDDESRERIEELLATPGPDRILDFILATSFRLGVAHIVKIVRTKRQPRR